MLCPGLEGAGSYATESNFVQGPRKYAIALTRSRYRHKVGRHVHLFPRGETGVLDPSLLSRHEENRRGHAILRSSIAGKSLIVSL